MTIQGSPWIISNPERHVLSGLREFWEARPVLAALIKRDLKSRYRTSFFGFAWAFAKPLMQLVVYVLVIGSVLGANRSIGNFPIFIFSGLMFWNFFAESVIVGSLSVITASGLVTKVSFPREVLPVSSVLIAGINLMIQMPVLLLGYLATGSKPNFEQINYLVPLLLSLFLICMGLSLLLSSLTVYARDIAPLSELLVMLFMYLCPVIYSWTFVSDAINHRFGNLKLFQIYELNPLSQIITGIQDFFWNGQRLFKNGEVAKDFMGFTSSWLWLGTLGALAFALISYKVFLKLEPNFAREL